MNQLKKMAFYEVGKGRFAQWMQEEFERAQRFASETGCEVKINATIGVMPPRKGEENFGEVRFAVKATLPARKSMSYTTELSGGMIVADGEDILDLLQEELQFPAVISVNRETGEVING